jgi:hypothetical protein
VLFRSGLYRHGWLLAPALVDDALRALGLRALPTSDSPPLHTTGVVPDIDISQAA